MTAPCGVLPVPPASEEPHDPAPGRLKDLLYPDKANIPAREVEWVGLVEAIAAGDQRALHALFERTHRLVFTLIVRITNDRATAEEVTLDVFHDVWQRAPTYRAEGKSVVGWIMNQARSRAIDRVRFETRKKRIDPHPDDPLVESPLRGPDEALDVREQNRLLRTALTTLTPDERQAIETAFFSEMTYVEVADRLKQPIGTVKTRIRNGLEKLRGALAKTRQGR